MDQIQKKYLSRVAKKLIWTTPPGPVFGRNAMLILHRVISRSLALALSVRRAIDSKDVIGMCLGIRAHLETTAFLAIVRKKFTKYYEGKISEKDLSDFMKRASLGSKTQIKGADGFFEAVNVLTAIDTADELLKELGAEDKFVREEYEYLSEFCHPNFMGLTFGTRLLEKPKGTEFISFEDAFLYDARGFAAVMNISLNLFFEHFDKAFRLVEKHEQRFLPKIIR